MVSIVDVARHAGVSQATVSRVLGAKVFVASETREKVLDAVAALGYQPSSLGKALRSGYLDSIAFLVSDIEQGWYSALAKKMQVSLQSMGLEMLLFDLSHSEKRLAQMLERSNSLRLRAVVLATSDTFDFVALRPLLEKLAAARIAVLSIGQNLEEHGIASILHDDLRAGIEGVDHLVGKGRSRIAYLNRISLSTAGRQRYEGYLAGLTQAGLPVDNELIWGSPLYRFEGGYKAVENALETGVKFDGILAGTDELAIGAIAAIKDRGLRVPEDISVIGFGGLELSQYMRPRLTTLSGNAAMVAQHVSQLLFEQTPKSVTIERQLVVRDST